MYQRQPVPVGCRPAGCAGGGFQWPEPASSGALTQSSAEQAGVDRVKGKSLFTAGSIVHVHKCTCMELHCTQKFLRGDMKRGEESTEKVVQSDLKGVQPLLAEIELEGWVLLRALGEWES